MFWCHISSIKSVSISFFSSSETHQSHYLIGCRSFLIYFLHGLRRLSLLNQVIILQWLIVSGSSLSRVSSSTLILLMSIVLTPILSLRNVTILESTSSKNISTLETTELSSFSNILFVTSQSKINLSDKVIR